MGLKNIFTLYDFKFNPILSLIFAVLSSPNPRFMNQDFVHPSSDPRKLNRPLKLKRYRITYN